MFIRLFFFLTAIAAFVACNQNDTPDMMCNYCECCTTPALEASFATSQGEAKVMAPSIFLLDGPDIVSSRFLVTTNDVVVKISSLVVNDADGNLLFERTDMVPNDPAESWDGYLPTGAPYTGTFMYTITFAAADGTLKTYSGQACIFRCGDPDFPAGQLDDCVFPGSSTGIGGSTPTDAFDDCF